MRNYRKRIQKKDDLVWSATSIFPSSLTSQRFGTALQGHTYVHQMHPTFQDSTQAAKGYLCFAYHRRRSMRPFIVRAFIGGFFGTIALIVLLYYSAPAIGVNMDWA